MSVETDKSPRMEHPDKCRYCDAEIFWRTNNVTRRAAPIDAYPDLNGNIEVVDDQWYRIVPKGSLFEQEQVLYLNHFVTCKNPPKRR